MKKKVLLVENGEPEEQEPGEQEEQEPGEQGEDEPICVNMIKPFLIVDYKWRLPLIIKNEKTRNCSNV